MRLSLRERFEQFIMPEPNSGCWLWMSVVTKQGYGQFTVNSTKREGAHRVSYRLYKGKIPRRKEVDHTCRVRCCVNPDHLEAVTHAENIARGQAGKYQMKKTHCPKGHPYAGDNLMIIMTEGYRKRRCRTCQLMKGERYRNKTNPNRTRKPNRKRKVENV